MSTPALSPRRTVERFLRAVVSPDPGDMADCYAERFVIEMPFASGLGPERTETTREEIRARFAAGAAVRRYTAVRVRSALLGESVPVCVVDGGGAVT